MNLLNRALIVSLALLGLVFWLAAVVVAVVLPQEIVSFVKGLVSFIDGWVQYFSVPSYQWQLSLGVIILALIGGVISFLLLWIETAATQLKEVRLRQVAGDVVMLTTDAITQRVRFEAEQVPQVRRAEPRVISRGDSVDVRLDLYTELQDNVAATTDAVCRRVRESAEGEMGAKLRILRVRVHHVPSATGARHRAEPLPTHATISSAQPSPASPPENRPATRGLAETVRWPEDGG